MPIVLREGSFFYSGDGEEPQHVHVARDNRIAKFWLDQCENTEERRTEAIRDTTRTTGNRRESQFADGGVG